MELGMPPISSWLPGVKEGREIQATPSEEWNKAWQAHPWIQDLGLYA